MATEIRADDWFEMVTGIDERNWKDFDIASLPKAPADMGTFRTPTIAELEDEAAAMPSNDTPPVLKLVTRLRAFQPKLFDTSALQVNGPQRALYQVASNFNCMEVGSVATSPFYGKFVTRLMTDTTQGPAAAGGAGLGAILRVAKHKQKEINLLCNTQLVQDNGKLDGFKPLPSFEYRHIQIGLHTDIRATFDRSIRGQTLYYPNGPLIDQVFTSTVICPRGHGVALPFLRAAYDGTYLAAVVRQSPRIVLTLIGGACFENPLSEIAQAMAEAHRKYGPKLAPGCEVCLPLYEPGSPFVRELAKIMAADEFTVEVISS